MKKKIMAVLLALAMVTQGAMPVFAQNEGAEGIETAADAETAKILSPQKKVVIPDLKAGCSLSDSCPAPVFALLALCLSHQGCLKMQLQRFQ